MQNIILSIALLLSCACSNAQQSLPNFSVIPLKTEKDFTKEADDAALIAAHYIMSTPLSDNDISLKEATVYLIKWMAGTPEYTFELSEPVLRHVDETPSLMPVVVAAMAEFELQNKSQKNNAEKVNRYAIERLVKYAATSSNNVEPNNALKKALEADRKGKLNAYIDKLLKEMK